MKKALGGCLAAAVVLLVLGGIALWFLVIKPAAVVADRALEGAREGIAQVTDLGRTVARMRELEAGVRTPGPYAAPADGRLTAAQVDRFLTVQTAVVAALGPAAVVPDAPAGDLVGAVAEAAGALRALARLGEAGLAAKQAQVDALNAQTMSLDEYRWVRERATEVLVAGGVSMAVAGAGAAGGEVLGRAGETAQQLGEAARQAADAAVAATETARRAAQAARDAWQGKPPAATPPADAAPQQPADAPPAADASSTAADGSTTTPAPLPGVSTDVRLIDLPLVAPHAEAFIRARALAAIGL